MTRNPRLSILAAVTAAGAFLASAFSNQAVAQIRISVPTISRLYYNGYSTHYRLGSGYRYGRHAYSVYGNGPYGYGSAVLYGYTSPGGYGYSRSAYHSTYYDGAYLRGGRYRRVYVPQSTRYYYSPYGYEYRGY